MYMLLLFAKLTGTLVAFIALFAIYRHVKAVKRVQFYAAQGMTALPGYDSFLLGNAKQIFKYRALRDAN